MTLAKLATAAVRLVNKENDIRLKKMAEVGDEARGAVVYKDTAWCEYRVMFFENGAHKKDADYHTCSITREDAEDAGRVAAAWTAAGTVTQNTADVNQMETETADAIDAVEALTATMNAESEIRVTRIPPTRPRGYYAKPSALFSTLFARAN